MGFVEEEGQCYRVDTLRVPGMNLRMGVNISRANN